MSLWLLDADPVLEIVGLEVPNAGPVFLTALAVHVAAGLSAVGAGALAALSRKRHGRHPRAGQVYLAALAVLVCTAAVMAAIRWEHNRHLLVIATTAAVLAYSGWLVRRRRPVRWQVWHGMGMAGSYIALLTGFYVDNGPQLPVWDRLPTAALWLLPTAVGAPVTWWALRRNGLLGAHRSRPVQPGQPGASPPAW